MRVVASGYEPSDEPVVYDPDDHRLKVTERQLQDSICSLADALGWSWYHTYDSRRSKDGFPDLVLWHPRKRRTIYAELKSQNGNLTTPQRRTLQELADAGNHVHVWRPSDWITAIVEQELQRK